MWEKRIGRNGGRDPWRDDFPLSRNLPGPVVIDCSALEGPIHPMFAVRLAVFRDWHAHEGRTVQFKRPRDASTSAALDELGVFAPSVPGAAGTSALILPTTNLREFMDVEDVATQTRSILEYERLDVSVLGAATFMAVSELCGNAIEHGAHDLGAYVAVVRVEEPTPRVQLAIADLGMGIPEHVRQHHPEWHDDTAAIAQATERGISGTGESDRGNGFSEVFDAALTTTLHAAQIEIYSANGFLRTDVVQEARRHEPFPAPQFRRGTWITYELISAQ